MKCLLPNKTSNVTVKAEERKFCNLQLEKCQELSSDFKSAL